jgi:hypothetical protein
MPPAYFTRPSWSIHGARGSRAHAGPRPTPGSWGMSSWSHGCLILCQYGRFNEKEAPAAPFSPEAQGCRRLREHNQGRVVRGMKDLAALHKTGTVVFIEGGYDSGQRTGLKFLLLNCRHLSSPDHSHQASSY